MRIDATQPFVPVILGGDIGAYSLAREFHEAYGVVSVVVPSVLTGLVRFSSILETRVFADQDNEEAFLAFVTELVAEVSRDGDRPVLLLASNDPHTRLIVENREHLSRWATIPYPDLDQMLKVTSKEGFDELCRRTGVPTPRTAVVRATDAIVEKVAQVGVSFPAIVKASDSVAWQDIKFVGQKKVHAVDSIEELEELIAQATQAGYDDAFIVQDFIPGPDSGMHLVTFFVDRAGEIRFVSAGRVIVEEHAPGALGNSAAILSGDYPQIVEAGKRLMETLKWRGFAMFDIKWDPRDNEYKFFELNPRLGRSHFYVTAAGANVSRFYVEEFIGGELSQIERFVVNTEEHLYSVLPKRLLKRYVPGDLTRTVASLMRQRKHSHPLVYRKEKHPRRWLYILLSLVNQYRKFKRFHPAP